jgi:molecular chaperone DnaK (HSP70)
LSAVVVVVGKEQSIRIEASSGLTDKEIEKMKIDAEKHAKEDEGKKETVLPKDVYQQSVQDQQHVRIRSKKDNNAKFHIRKYYYDHFMLIRSILIIVFKK